MTLDEFMCLCSKHAVPFNAKMMSDSGWECCATDMNGIYYNKMTNTICFTQSFGGESYDKNRNWKPLK